MLAGDINFKIMIDMSSPAQSINLPTDWLTVIILQPKHPSFSFEMNLCMRVSGTVMIIFYIIRLCNRALTSKSSLY